jgi:predicted ATPase/DNA-binding XRE family transcriptional regulator
MVYKWRHEDRTTTQHEERIRGSSAFGILLRQYRLAAGLSQEALAERARLSTNGIGALERGYRHTPQRETLALLADALALDEGQREEFETAAARSGPPRRMGGASVTVGPWSNATIAKLPLALTSFVGRESELAEIAALVRDHRMVTLTGAGGVGKTQTALHVAAALNDVDAALCFVGLAPIDDPSLVATAIASALGVQEVPNHPLIETLIAYLKNKTLLLILDNCEHVIRQAAVVATALLASCPRVRILATSRESLKAAGEHSYRLPSMHVPSPEAVGRLDATSARAYEAIVLFTDRARAADYRFALTDENAPVVAKLCRRLDGVPLAIELAAARVSQLPLKTLAEKLHDRFRILTGGVRTALPRQQTMRAAIDWSYELLTALEQRVFERLSVFAGGCALAEGAVVCSDQEIADEDVFDLFSSLVDKSLLVVDLEASEPRYWLLESFRQYAHEKLAARRECDLAAHSHALAYLGLAQSLDHTYYDEQEIFFRLAHEELDNWRAALQWALTDQGDALLGQRLVGELCRFWQSFAPIEGRRWLLCALEFVDERTPASILARLSYTEATIAQALGQHEVQLARSRSAVARYRVLDDLLGVGLAQSQEIGALLAFGLVAEAKSVLTEAVQLAHRVGNRWLLAWAQRASGSVSSADGDLVAARVYLAEALQNYEALGAQLDAAIAKYVLSVVDFRAGNAQQALRHAADALMAFRAFNHAQGVTTSLNLAATYLVSLGRYDEAEEHVREAFDVAREQQLDVVASWNLESIVGIAVLRKQDCAERRHTTYVRAARILGFVDARLAAMGSIREQVSQQMRSRVSALLRNALGTDAVVQLMTEGAAMTEEQTVEEALII